MNLDGNIYSVWLENEDGTRFIPDMKGGDYAPGDAPGDEFYAVHSEMPLQVTHEVMRQTIRSEVEACEHPADAIKPTDGWVEGVEGRECGKCQGTQTRNTTKPWPELWDAEGARPVCSGSVSLGRGSAGLILAMTRPTTTEINLSWERVAEGGEGGYKGVVPRTRTEGTLGFVAPQYEAVTGAKAGDPMAALGPGPKLYELDEAILIVARTCERCMNVLLWEYGCDDGYQHGSDEYERAGTTCLFCVPIETIHPDPLVDEVESAGTGEQMEAVEPSEEIVGDLPDHSNLKARSSADAFDAPIPPAEFRRMIVADLRREDEFWTALKGGASTQELLDLIDKQHAED